MKRLYSLLPLLLVVLLGLPPIVWAQSGGGLRLIRDAESEAVLREITTPIFAAAGLDVSAVRIIIINDDRLNAFVSGGQNVFIHTGLLTATTRAAELLGVVAHEVGHIAGGHLARRSEVIANARLIDIVSTVLGIAVAGAGGLGSGGAAVLTGGQSLAANTYFSHSRIEENSADQAAVTYLQAIGLSPSGLLSFMRVLEKKDSLGSQRNLYYRSHPLTSSRVDFLTTKNQNAANLGLRDDLPAPQENRYQRVIGKIAGFLQPARDVLAQPADTTPRQRMARLVAHYRAGDAATALSMLGDWLNEEPNDAYLHELRGQILFETGQTKPAVLAYERALALAPDEALIKVGLAQALIALADKASRTRALALLNQAVLRDPDYSLTHRLLAVAYGQNNNIGMAALHLAELELLSGKPTNATMQATRAQRLLPENSPGWNRASEIIDIARKPKAK